MDLFKKNTNNIYSITLTISLSLKHNDFTIEKKKKKNNRKQNVGGKVKERAMNFYSKKKEKKRKKKVNRECDNLKRKLGSSPKTKIESSQGS